jgi:5-methyltetrahydropteroyltriglutamate--homocysteine methyltransferase
MRAVATCLGHPRIGADRELKRALESFWSRKSSREELESVARELRCRHWLAMKSAGIDHVPSNDFSLYDQVLDMAICLGAVPQRYRRIADPLWRMFAMARGVQDPGAGLDVPALEMTKWFDTNYHYIVPELELEQSFQLDASRILAEIGEARALGIEPRPVIVGPVTFLRLAKLAPGAPLSATTLDLLGRVLPAYEQLLVTLAHQGVAWAEIDEPCLAVDLDGHGREAYRQAFERLSFLKKRPKLLLATYFAALEDNLDLALRSRLEALHVDLVRAPEQLDAVVTGLDSGAILSMGVVDGRNIWRTDLDRAHALIRRAVRQLGAERVWVAPSCSLLHSPVDLSSEQRLDPEIKPWLAFARQKLDEVAALADAASSEAPATHAFAGARAAIAARRASPRTRNPAVRERLDAIDAAMLGRASRFPDRAALQRARFRLPPLPTTTIGSFPQTADVRAARARWRQGKLANEDYVAFLKTETRRCIEKQEALGLDVLVHGELERNDMVEYFGEQLTGFAFTENGWVQSYGSRCVKPPVLFGDVARPRPMTLDWSRYAQSLTEKPMKGMLTGPVTILQWSFVRDDQPRELTCKQTALALRDEVADLEAAGIGIIQVDEAAIREGLPLRRHASAAYLRWAVDAFRIATSVVRDDTQIHTHMCYSEFGDILPAIVEMDADVLSIETSRSKMELLGDFGRLGYPNEVGPGVYDIHAPRVPTTQEIEDLLGRALCVVPSARLWVNPDCGLKTRGWAEVDAALANMVEAARRVRLTIAGKST